jgi:2-polyprenyl-3-methyl-5-hydroxy-6-metoxy-1,4-benzoquinol methylase
MRGLQRLRSHAQGKKSHGRSASGEESAAYYDNVYAADPGYCEPYWQSYYYFLWSVIVDRIRRCGATTVLEIGCGSGRLAEFLIDQGVQQYHGLDFSKKAIEIAKSRGLAASFCVDDARSSSLYRTVKYDALICTEVLEHIEDDLRVVARIRSGARCWLSVPNFQYARRACQVVCKHSGRD